MSEVEHVETPEVEAVQTPEVPDVDLSAVPEKHRDYVDVERYASNEDYKRAIDHGYKPEKLYQEEGLDPDNFIGYKSWLRNYDKRQEEKAVKSELAEIRKAQEELLRTQKQREQEAVQRALEAKEAELRVAMEEGDAKRAVALSNEINQAKMQPAPQQAPVLAPVFQDFIEDHPVLNPQSTEYDAAFAENYWASTTQEAADFQKSQGGRALSHPEIEFYLNRSMKRMSKSIPQKTQAKAPAVAKPATTAAKVTDLKTRLTPEAQSTYNRLLTAKGGGKEVADRFAKEILGA